METQSIVPILVAVLIAFVVWKISKKIINVILFLIFIGVVYAMVSNYLR